MRYGFDFFVVEDEQFEDYVFEAEEVVVEVYLVLVELIFFLWDGFHWVMMDWYDCGLRIILTCFGLLDAVEGKSIGTSYKLYSDNDYDEYVLMG